MASIHELISQIPDLELRTRIEVEAAKLSKDKRFGLVFEEHLPECTPLYGMMIKRGSLVSLKTGNINDMYIVTEINGGNATCIKRTSSEICSFPINDLVITAQFGDPIYPYLYSIDNICNAPDSNLWHSLIEADNYHALQLLEYLYSGKVDCIYIDPPYNTGAKDWKYNNNYVDGVDAYRHSKWLSFMERRLKLAKKLLNPKDSVLIVTIDEKEYLHLGMLLEQMFPEARIQMVSITINPSGAKRDQLFSRSDEYAYFILFGSAHVNHPNGAGNEEEVRWWYLRRTDYSSRRGTVKGGTAQFYPIYVDINTMRIIEIGEPLTINQSVNHIKQINGAIAVFPIREDGVEMNWGLKGDSLKKLLDEGMVRVTEGSKNQPYVFRYLSANYKEKIKKGRWAVRGERPDGTKIVVEVEGKITRATTVWQNKLHDAGQYGTSLLRATIGSGKFSFPKSLYAVQDTLSFFVKQKPNALILDFFAGSGTTLHAVNLLNAEDGGNRRCILVTNNEVSESEAKSLAEKGFKPGDEQWEALGIARYVTWPRTVCSILGKDTNGNPLKGNYLGSDIPMADGFRTNAIYFKLGFLDKDKVSLGMQLNELLPILWLKTGAIGQCPVVDLSKQNMLIAVKNRFAILIEESCFTEFSGELDNNPEIQTAFLVTDSDTGYQNMVSHLNVCDTYQLYRDYLDNFRINHGR
ncbi:MAG: DNA methyltransferase [Bacteroidales bacterium]|nr:DNA methyltransferase [Bacteroidales bacterium]